MSSWALESFAGEGKLEFSGDLRGRFESFWYEQDGVGRKEDRRRLRYRLRVNAKATINEHAKAVLRFSTGASDSRSGNETLGSPRDFSPNGFVVRRAYLVFSPFANGEIPNQDGFWTFQFGRLPVPFVWKNGKDMMLWDNDFNLGGGATFFDMDLSGRVTVFANVGGFMVYENKTEKDPVLGAAQAGTKIKVSDKIKAGVRGSLFYFEFLDADFVHRGYDGKDVDGEKGATSGGGNILDGLTGDPAGGSLQVIETQGFVKFDVLPVLVYGGFSTNMSAEASEDHDVDKEAVAYNAGIEGGDKKKNVKLGVGYYHIEANAFPSQFIDSDLFDGRTNRAGVIIYGSRQVYEGTEFGFKLFNSDAIEKDLPAFEKSVDGSKRTRLQVDLVYKF